MGSASVPQERRPNQGELVAPGRFSGAVSRRIARLAAERVTERLWARDHTLWKPDPAEITNRLG